MRQPITKERINRFMIESGLVDKGRMLSLFQSIEPMLIRYPAVAPRAFAKRVQEICHEDS